MEKGKQLDRHCTWDGIVIKRTSCVAFLWLQKRNIATAFLILLGLYSGWTGHLYLTLGLECIIVFLFIVVRVSCGFGDRLALCQMFSLYETRTFLTS